MTTTVAERNKQRLAQLAEAEASLGILETPTRITSYDGTPAAELQRKRVAENQRLIDEQRRKEIEHAQAYRLQEKTEIDAVVDGNSLVAQLEAEHEEAQGALAALYAKHRGVVTQLAELESAAVNFEGVETDDLATHATAWEKKHAAGLSATRAARVELERRISLAEAGVMELRHSLHRAQRVAIHKHIDSLIEEIRGPIERTNDLMQEIRRYESHARSLGGPRQTFASSRLSTALEGVIEYWDKELVDVKRFSEQYD